jgi:transcriptional regulator GlxA family with amidase domain
MTKRIGLLLYPDFQILDAAGPIAAFEIAARLVPNAYELTILSTGGDLVRSSSGALLASLPVQTAGALDTLLIVGGLGSRQAMHCPTTQAFVRARALSARRMCGVCSGAFLLAAAGLLDGRRATTHWRRAEELARLFPRVAVEPDAIHVHDGPVWTSAGITAGIDLALALIAEDCGDPIARRVAQTMVVYYRRPGGQSQFSALLDMGGDETRFSALLGWMRAHLDARLTIDVLADQAAMSPRHFTRAFKQAMGVSPAKAVERLRLEVARERTEHSSQPIEAIAAATGFHDPERMRRAFLRAFGQPPQAMRRLARQG